MRDLRRGKAGGSSMRTLFYLTQQELVNRNEQQLDDEADDAHDEEADRARGRDFNELLLVGLAALLQELHAVVSEAGHGCLSVLYEVCHL